MTPESDRRITVYPIRRFIIREVSGDGKITGVRTFGEFATEDDAVEAARALCRTRKAEFVHREDVKDEPL